MYRNLLVIFGMGVLLLAGCAPSATGESSPEVGNPPTAAATQPAVTAERPTPLAQTVEVTLRPSETPAGMESATATPNPGPTAALDQTPAPAETAAGEPRRVTLSEDGQTITLHGGERFLLFLGEQYQWSPVVADPTVVQRVPGVLVIRGAQGLYAAVAAGQTTLTASGEPLCRQSKPACGQPNRAFEVKIVVEP